MASLEGTRRIRVTRALLLRTMDAGLIPVKPLARAKSRLGPDFDDVARAAIARALLEDALALAESAPFLRWWVVTEDDEAAAAATQRGFERARDDGDGLNAALASGIAAAVSAGASSVTIV